MLTPAIIPDAQFLMIPDAFERVDDGRFQRLSNSLSSGAIRSAIPLVTLITSITLLHRIVWLNSVAKRIVWLKIAFYVKFTFESK